MQFVQREKAALTVKNDGVYRFICYESLIQELRARQSTAIGRDRLRQRTTVEQALAHIGHWQRGTVPVILDCVKISFLWAQWLLSITFM
ncbi:hypothetical protein QUB67_21890 [Microcoleus sp. ARI1-A1]|uniref:hypothetical protein n=1 Tax=unclassified Microcoleus TaxID=2642155 RepID=UPI002FD14382